MDAQRKAELDQIEKFIRQCPHRVYRAKLGETTDWEMLSLREKRRRQANAWWRNRKRPADSMEEQ